MTKAEAIEAIKKLDELCSVGGYAEEETLREIRGLCVRLQGAPRPSGLVHEKVVAVEAWAEILFSQRKHERYGGPAAVRTSLRHDLASLRHIVDRAADDDA